MRSFVVVVAVASAHTGCLDYCTALDAPSSLELQFAEPLAEEGVWEVRISGGERVVTCTMPVPVPEPPGSQLSCDDIVSSWTVTGDRQVLGVTAERFTAPEIEVEVLLDGAQVNAFTLAPDYTISEPNGKGCGERYQATEVLDLAG